MSYRSSQIISQTFLPVLLLLIAMISIQSGASLAKSLFPLLGASGVTALRLIFGTIILCLIFKPWRLRFSPEKSLSLLIYGLSLGGMNYLFYLAINKIPLGIAVALEFTGPLAVALFGSRRLTDFLWGILAVWGLWFLLPINQTINSVDPEGAALAIAAGVCWAFYILAGKRAGSNHGAASVAAGSIIASLVFVPIGMTFAEHSIWQLTLIPTAIFIAILSTALPYSLEMIALTRLPTRSFGTLMSLEPAMAAFSGMIFLGERLTLTQWLALLAIIIASAGTTLTMWDKKASRT